MNYKPYSKVILENDVAICAIYEPNPFRPNILAKSLGYPIDASPTDDEWTWVQYDGCGNPIAIGDEKPDGVEVDKFTIENLKLTWTTPECAQKLCDYLNMEPNVEENNK